MLSKNSASVPKDDLGNISKEELIIELKKSREETFKYVNKLLEVEERWSFINLFLKKLNSIKHKQELCKNICDGFLKLTDSKFCACYIFNQDSLLVEVSALSYADNSINKGNLSKFINTINKECSEFMKKSVDMDVICKFFQDISDKFTIIVPIIYMDTFLGYLLLKNEYENFYKENIHFVSIFPEHIALILENISLYQESEKNNKRKIEFLAGISHEFKTPLNSIIGFAEILKINNETPDNSKYINNILHSSKHLLTLIQDVLDVSKSQYKTLELRYITFNTKDEILQILLALEKMTNEKNIELNYTLADINISADVKRFRQLIYNLVSNAVKFNRQNGKVNILTYIKDNKFFFEVVDTGDGISKRNYEKIFNFFSQVNRSQLKRQLGSGVGLALCKKITDAHNGEISFKSELKKGSCFWFSLPLFNN